MAGMTKELKCRMDGMIYAYSLVEKGGIEALRKDIKLRNLTKLDVNVSQEQINKAFKDVCANLYVNVLTSILWTLHEVEGYGAKRIARLKETMDKQVEQAIDLDYLGEHYVTVRDYAVELNDKYKLGLDLNRMQNTQEAYDKGDRLYHKADIDRVIDLLAKNNHKEAADFLQSFVLKRKI